MNDLTGLQESRGKIKKPSPPFLMCKSCDFKKETPLSGDRNKWPINKIEYGCYLEICDLLDLTEHSKKPLMSALGCFEQGTGEFIEKKYKEKGGMGIAKEALGKWASSKKENDVGAFKKILENIMHRVDVVTVIENWEKMSVCHGCGIKLNP